MMRPTNAELCTAFRELMTDGFRVPRDADRDAALALTKPWRGDLWRAFREIEERLCPQPGAQYDEEGQDR
ncbi:MAG: hypothetical protein DI527_00585 [Chelatococcus sp.]|nr:MAG: hypothetical protein DI527_00585 [Chelatococcus sp.]